MAFFHYSFAKFPKMEQRAHELVPARSSWGVYEAWHRGDTSTGLSSE